MASRIGKKVWIILGIGVFVVVAAILANTYVGQLAERDDLTARLSVAQRRLADATAEKGELEEDLAAAESRLARSQGKYPESLHSIEYGEHVFDIVRQSRVSIPSLSFPTPSNATEGPVTYRVVGLSLSVSGGLSNVFDFIEVVRTDPRFATTRVNSINLNVRDGSAGISVTIYAYRR